MSDMGAMIAAMQAAAGQNATVEQRACAPCKSPGNSGKCWCETPCGTPDCSAIPPVDRPGDIHLAHPVPVFTRPVDPGPQAIHI